MNVKRNALGKGLGALLAANETSEREEMASKGTMLLALDLIEVNPYQPRTDFDQDALQELADSIQVLGIIQPLTIRTFGDKYQLIAGERRLRASKMAGLTHVPAFVIETDNQGMLEMALVENIQRDDLNPMEIAFSYKRLIDECNLIQESLGERVGKDRTTVTNYLRLLKLPPPIQAALRDATLTMGHAKALLAVSFIDQQLALFQQCVREAWSVRKTEAAVKALLNPAKTETKTVKPANRQQMPPIDPNLRHVQDQLTARFDAKVAIRQTEDEKGEIIIPYLSNDDLNRILDLLEI